MQDGNFLSKVAYHLYNQFSDNLRKQTLIVPGKRAGAILSKKLAAQNQVIILPEIITIEEFYQRNSNFLLADKLTLLEELYLVYIQKNSNEPFDQFIPWGEMLLSDFDEIDKFLVNAQMLYSNLQDIKAFDQWMEYLNEQQLKTIAKFWKTFNSGTFKNRDEFIQIWKSLYPIYAEFKENLKAKNWAYMGMIERELAENIKKFEAQDPNEKYIFIGLNALTNAQIKLFKYLDINNLSYFYWDASSYYLQDENNQAGKFIRENISLFKNAKVIESGRLGEGLGPNVEVLGMASEVLQVKQVAASIKNLLNENPDILNSDHVVPFGIVLHNENLLPHLLTALSPLQLGINITMGYPLEKANIYRLVFDLLDLYKSSKVELNKPNLYHHKNIVNVVESPIFIESPILSKPNNNIKQAYYIPENLSELGHKIFVPKFEQILVFNLIEILNYIAEFQYFKDDEVEDKALITIQKLLNQIVKNPYLLPSLANADAIKRILKKLSSRIRFPFILPLQTDINIMGLLETRGQSFHYLFVLNANEGNFPANTHKSSYIPYNLKKGFGLPLPDTQSAIQEYYYYQILENSSNISFYYNSEVNDFGTSEPSRYLYKLKLEKTYQSYYQNNVLANFEIARPSLYGISVARTSKILEKLNKIEQISPSAINVYMDCSLKFYYRYVVGIEEENKILNGIEANVFGELLHDTMEFFYKEKLGKIVEKEWIEQKEPEVENLMKLAFSKQFDVNVDSISLKGLELIYFEILKKYIHQILKIDKLYAPFLLEGVEYKDIEYEIFLKNNEREKNIKIVGSIDRIDRKDGIIRILDYKTGGDSNSFETEFLFEQDSKKRNKAAFQILLYALMYELKKNTGQQYQPGLFSRSEMFNKNFEPVLSLGKVKFNFDVNKMQDFNTKVLDLLEKIFISDDAFTQTEDSAKCQFCPYNIFCKR